MLKQVKISPTWEKLPYGSLKSRACSSDISPVNLQPKPPRPSSPFPLSSPKPFNFLQLSPALNFPWSSPPKCSSSPCKFPRAKHSRALVFPRPHKSTSSTDFSISRQYSKVLYELQTPHQLIANPPPIHICSSTWYQWPTPTYDVVPFERHPTSVPSCQWPTPTHNSSSIQTDNRGSTHLDIIYHPAGELTTKALPSKCPRISLRIPYII